MKTTSMLSKSRRDISTTIRKSNPIWIFAIITIFVLLILNIAFSTKILETKKSLINLETKSDFNFTKIALQSKCPDSAGGDINSYLRIKYFYSDYCAWCKKEDPILQKLVSEYGHSIYIEWFNIAYCPEETDKYSVSGVPTFIFSTSDANNEYSHYGFIYEKDLKKLICDVVGECEIDS